jgi:hypothetical protein
MNGGDRWEGRLGVADKIGDVIADVDEGRFED